MAPSTLPDTAAIRRARAWLEAADLAADVPIGDDGATDPGRDGRLTAVGVDAAIPPADVQTAIDVAERRSHRHRVLIEWTAVLAGALLVALVIKVLLFQAFVIPSESMVPTLGVGDRVLVNKASYRLGDVGRGDLVVFERPAAAGAGDDADLIKRVIGLPGETITASGGVVYVDDRVLPEDYLPRSARTDDFPAVTLGPDELFVMGDNRQSSRDSRFFGPVPTDLVIGRAFLRVWPPGGFGGL